jgi:nucleoside-diphosphate-sugar epimerase/dTDP-4-dehydrorhamnose 3,5-epimerase-like enzyme/SAM-dependent methyltransferase
MKKKIIITGGLGYLGSELCKIYSGFSWYDEVVVIDKNFFSERVTQLRKWHINFYQGDILDKNFLKKILSDASIVIHLAGITDVAYVKKESNYHKDNEIAKVAIEGTNNVLNLMPKDAKIIFPSTHVIFDGLKETSINLTEESDPKPMLAYSKSKHQNEKDIINSGKNFVILRLGSVYGYSIDTTRINIMPNLFSKIASQDGTIKLFSGGKQIKSLIPLIDVVRCFKFMADRDEINNEIFNLTKDNVSVKEVALICKKINKNVALIETTDEVPNLGYTLCNKKLLKSGFRFLYNLKYSLEEMITQWRKSSLKKDKEYTYKGSKEFIDSRGKISNYELTEPINLIGYIESKKHTVRANHFHPIQEQKCLVVKGQFISVIKNLIDGEEKIETGLVSSGEMVVTKPNVAHSMLFTEDTIFLNLVRGEREHENYGITHTIPHVLIDQTMKKKLIETCKLNCRCCDGTGLKRILSLGFQPLANNLIKSKKEKIETYPLELNYCINCFNVQLSCSVSSDQMFKNYLYLSSTSKIFQNHFEQAARKYIAIFKLSKKDNILDIGSNDGIGLVPFQKKSFINLYGIEPAKNLSKITKKLKIKTFNNYLNLKLANKINKKFKLITASNVFAHSDDLNSMTKSVKKLLRNDGVFVIEVQYLLNTIKDLTFDNIYHEHVNYWSVTCLKKYLKKFDLFLFDVEKINTHGGSVRAYVSKNSKKYKIKSSVERIVLEEKKFGIDKFETFNSFASKIYKLKKNFQNNFKKLNSEKVVFYGSPAKATTKLNFYGLQPGVFDTIEDNPLKIGKIIPGVNVTICNKSKYINSDLDCIIVLAWNFFNEIKNKNQDLSAKFLSIQDLEEINSVQ